MTALVSVKKPKKQTCGNCRYYFEAMLPDGRRFDPEVSGICRRFPPAPLAYGDGDEHIETVAWPMVAVGEYCGEHEPI